MRGTGSLQALLGRSTYSSAGRKRKSEDIEASTSAVSSDCPTEDATLASGSGLMDGNEVESPLKPGNVRCPVCSKQLRQALGDDFINNHIDKCLSKSKPKSNKQQATMLLFTQRTARAALPLASPPHHPSTTTTPAAATTALAAADAKNSDSLAKKISIPSTQDEEDEVSWGSPGSISQQSPNTAAISPTATAATSSVPFSLSSCIVGRQFQKGASRIPLRPGDHLSVQPEPNNPRDKNAILVFALSSAASAPSNGQKAAASNGMTALGHLPAAVARHLGPLLRKGVAVAEAVVLEAPAGDKVPVPIEIQITAAAVSGSVRTGMSEKAGLAAIKRAVDAATNASSSNGHGGGGGSGQIEAGGERLCRNFAALVATVREHDVALLADEEHSFLKAYEGVSLPARCLFLRLSQRCGPTFRILSFAYSDVPDPSAAAAELHAAGLVALSDSQNTTVATDCPTFSWQEVASVLTVPELQKVHSRLIFPNAPNTDNKMLPPPPATRPAVLAALQRWAESKSNLSKSAVLAELLSTSGPLLRILPEAITALKRLQRLFFLNEGHSLGQFLATDAGAVRYAAYKVHRQSPAFPTRDHLVQYEIALQQAEQLTVALEEGDWDAAEVALAPAWAALDTGLHKQQHPISTASSSADAAAAHPVPSFLQRYSAPWVYCLMATAGVSLLEKQKKYREAADRLQQLLGGKCCPSHRGQWWLRLSTDLEHLNRPTDALEIAETALADEWVVNGDRLGLQRRILRLGKPPRRWKKPAWAAAAQREPREVRIEGRPLNNTTGLKSRFYGFDGEQCSVEELALQYYASDEGGGFTGAHTEGGIWATLFGLLMWPVLFSVSIPDAFRTPFQTAPLDLDSDSFYLDRKESIEKVLADVAAGAAPAMIASVWMEHQGVMCRGVSWDRWSLEELQEIVECLGGAGLATVCRLLAQDHAGWQGGMPDLLLWHPERGEAKLSEVKGPRDRLSDQQRAWIVALEDAGLAVEVLKVVEPEIFNGKGGKRSSSRK